MYDQILPTLSVAIGDGKSGRAIRAAARVLLTPSTAAISAKPSTGGCGSMKATLRSYLLDNCTTSTLGTYVVQALDGSVIDVAPRRDEEVRDCPHAGRPHSHGTRAAYLADRCSCGSCRFANRQAESRRTRAIVMGRWEPYVDARATREHLQLLRKDGLGIDRIVALSGVSRSTVRRLLTPTGSLASPLPNRIRPEVAARLLALDCAETPSDPRSLVDASPTQQLIADLQAAGYSRAELARTLGRSCASLTRTMSRSAVTLETAEAVTRLHRELRAGA